MELKYQIGQKLFLARCESAKQYVTCPDCGGTGHIRVIFHDDTEASIECSACRNGYDPPTGKIAIYERKPSTAFVRIAGLDIYDGGKIRWRIVTADDYTYIIEDEDDLLFLDAGSALQRAEKLAEMYNIEEQHKITKKEKDTRSWAWNASYHRREIKRMEQQIEYHRSKLSVASLKASKEKK